MPEEWHFSILIGGAVVCSIVEYTSLWNNSISSALFLVASPLLFLISGVHLSKKWKKFTRTGVFCAAISVVFYVKFLILTNPVSYFLMYILTSFLKFFCNIIPMTHKKVETWELAWWKLFHVFIFPKLCDTWKPTSIVIFVLQICPPSKSFSIVYKLS